MIFELLRFFSAISVKWFYLYTEPTEKVQRKAFIFELLRFFSVISVKWFYLYTELPSPNGSPCLLFISLRETRLIIR